MKLQRWSFLKELVPLALLLIALDYYVFGGNLLDWEPSPLWLLILLIAPRRGSIAGFVCGLTAAAIYLWNIAEHGVFFQDLLHRRPEFLIMPGLFLFFGVFLGAISERQIRRCEHFREKADSLATRLDTSEIKRAELERFALDMEKRLSGQSATLAALGEALKKLDSARSEEELLLELEMIARGESGACMCHIWRLSQEGALVLGGNGHESPPPIVQRISATRKVLSAADWAPSEGMEAGADLAALVYGDESERLVAALSGVSFARLSRNFILRFGILAAHAGSVLAALRDRKKLKSMAILDSDSGLLSEPYLRRRLTEEIAIAKRQKTGISLLACSVSCTDPQRCHRVETALACCIRASIRYSDGFSFFPKESAFVLILPQCDENGCRIVQKKIEAAFGALKLNDSDGREVYHLSWRMRSWDGHLEGDQILSRLLGSSPGRAAA